MTVNLNTGSHVVLFIYKKNICPFIKGNKQILPGEVTVHDPFHKLLERWLTKKKKYTLLANPKVMKHALKCS